MKAILLHTGVTETELLMSKDFDGQNRGFGFAIFHNHAAANHAKKVLSAPNFKCALQCSMLHAAHCYGSAAHCLLRICVYCCKACMRTHKAWPRIVASQGLCFNRRLNSMCALLSSTRSCLCLVHACHAT